MGVSATRSSAVVTFIAVCVSVVLVCVGGLMSTPQNAYAKGKSTAWVVSKVVYTDYQSDAGTETSTYTYTKKGLFKSKKLKGGEGVDKYAETTTYTYGAKGNMKSEVSKSTGVYADSFKKVYKANKKGYVVKAIEDGSTTHTYTYNKKGRLVKHVLYESCSTFKYNAKGRVKSEKTGNVDESDRTTFTYTYDKRGTVSKVVFDGGRSKMKNVYKNGRLVKQSVYGVEDGSSILLETYSYKYKKVSVASSMAKMVKAQQKNLINRTLPIEAIHK